ncbi:hypothetical protein ACTWQB_15805 [Piscibacillus sp. B03]|uniref:hypothetical protein n=1 Tax=Piscibacillus sp. B03 TaxID=3457430 RepID=UPI003FCD9880
MSKEAKISIGLLIFPVIVSALLILPVHEEYTTKGNIEPVTELGVDGSVYFTYVQSGIVENYIDKYYLDYLYEDTEYYSLNDYEYDYYTTDYEEDVQYYKEQTIVNAVNVTSGEGPEQENQNRITEIIQEASEYYGDSFGLMIAIGLLEEDLNKDYSQGGSLVMGKDDVYEVAKAAPNSKIIAVHMEAVNHWALSREDLKNFSQEKGFDFSLMIPIDGESYKF